MNKSYKSVWNESTGAWVAVSELATGRNKSKRAKTALSKAILAQIAVGGMSLAGAGAAMADDTDVQETNPTVAIADGAATVAELNASGVFTALSQPHMLGAQLLGDAAPTDPVVTGSPYLAQGKITAVGTNNSAVVAGADSLAVGAYASANDMSVAIGTRAFAGAGPTAAFATAQLTTRHLRPLHISVGKVGGEHKIVNVAAGTTTDRSSGYNNRRCKRLAVDCSGSGYWH